MSGMNLSLLVKYKDEILKAEIAALLFNLGKTHVGFWRQKDGSNFWESHIKIFEDEYKNEFKKRFGYEVYNEYKNYYQKDSASKTPLEIELESIDCKLKDFFINQKVQVPADWGVGGLYFLDIMKGKASNAAFVEEVFFKGCENINSGIDKGNPVEQMKHSLWIANSFGIFKRSLELKDLDEGRISFLRKLHNFLCACDQYDHTYWPKIREFVLEEIKSWYSRILSDSRFPINDVSLWDQAYMTATMFKAVLADLVLMSEDNSKTENQKVTEYMNKPRNIRWRILGIQYDKLGLAEKGYKPQQIQWYRDTAREIDEEIKKLLEYKYPIGNEVYRDETGIYFLVGEDLGEDMADNMAILVDDLHEIKKEILDIFCERSEDEFYPAIFLTKASRGLMNLGYLLQKARENYLKADWGRKKSDICLLKNSNNKAIGICQICGQRTVFVSERQEFGANICRICWENKTQGRLEKWWENKDGETIWVSELKDKNGRIALISLKFELGDWLSGDMLNSLVLNRKEYNDNFWDVKKFILLFLASHNWDKYENEIAKKIEEIENKKQDISTPNNKKEELGKQIKNYKKMRKVIKTIKELRENSWWEKSLNCTQICSNYQNKFKDVCKEIKKDYESIKTEIQYDIPLLENLRFFPEELAEDAYIGCERNGESFNDFIRQIFFGSITGTVWEKLVRENLNSKVNWDTEVIEWESLNDENVDFLSILILQFLLRKNPSPARLRRIWETTKEFFEEIERNLVDYAGIPEERKKRYYWKGKRNIPDGEYADGEDLFWVRNGEVYSISSPSKPWPEGKKFKLRRLDSPDKPEETYELEVKDAKYDFYKPYLSIIDPTPVSWQFVIPAEYTPTLIDRAIKKYQEDFGLVYGKLPLHIGVVVQEYQKPLYVGIKALRRIRRDVDKPRNLVVKKEAAAIKKVMAFQGCRKWINESADYYSLYWGEHNKGYRFYVFPDDPPRWIASIRDLKDREKIEIVPNTFDFEFLDTNTRRNDIYYNDKGKRSLDSKKQRPYEWEKWEKFQKFAELFEQGDEKKSGTGRKSKLQRLITVLYERLEVKRDGDMEEEDKALLAADFINILELKKDRELAHGIGWLLGISDGQEELYDKICQEMDWTFVQFFIDAYEFWHTALRRL
ncbi:CRISPR-associated protein, Csx11 family [Thermosyntropha lipolytica DSM 11003]|uniref:CRISPR-associated protein, Csx11 family n=1 Tax=Thermosyntropha lipolytica DSM 11003 TaxID=1123382 RepID=A0A1M5R6W4_9FIRM|nr:CRISPR-associated protein Csx11 [Thermosyntropha lipolytica]SHH22127.1 CRISPR-associated protein, Csx11 family [Thermosyntropha lipolytica DSM 11003]